MSILKYSQPDFYKFNSDSLELVEYAIESSSFKNNINVLDLCAGCGVIGIEYTLKSKNVSTLTLLELQKEYKQHIESNLKRLDTPATTIISDFNNYAAEIKYDLVLCNPPYFMEGHGRVSPDEKKQRSRTTNPKELLNLLKFGIKSLTDNGVFIIVHRENLNQIDKRFIEVKSINGGRLFRFILNKD